MTGTTPDPARPSAPAAWGPRQIVVTLGLVSLAADMVYEGMRSMAGPFLGSLGASALLVGLVTGAGEAVALLLRLVTGPWADHSGRHWRLTVLGYALTAVSVPLLALAPAVGAAGVVLAAALILAERTGKAIRSPAKAVLLARGVGSGALGRAFGLHKALDQVGAFSGPLLLASVAALTGLLWPGFLLLAIPGAVSLLLLRRLGRRAPELRDAAPPMESVQPTESVRPADPAPGPRATLPPGRHLVAALGIDLPPGFHRLALGCALATAGLMTFGVISYHFVATGLLPAAAAPLVYAGAMAVAALAALASGSLFDRRGAAGLVVVPVLVAVVPPLAFADHLAAVLLGVLVWGVATGVLDSTVKAQVAQVVPAARLATGYGSFAAVQGLGALVGGALAGALVTDHLGVLVGLVAAAQVVALALISRAR